LLFDAVFLNNLEESDSGKLQKNWNATGYIEFRTRTRSNPRTTQQLQKYNYHQVLQDHQRSSRIYQYLNPKTRKCQKKKGQKNQTGTEIKLSHSLNQNACIIEHKTQRKKKSYKDEVNGTK
jgi:hypothetical protein